MSEHLCIVIMNIDSTSSEIVNIIWKSIPSDIVGLSWTNKWDDYSKNHWKIHFCNKYYIDNIILYFEWYFSKVKPLILGWGILEGDLSTQYYKDLEYWLSRASLMLSLDSDGVERVLNPYIERIYGIVKPHLRNQHQYLFSTINFQYGSNLSFRLRVTSGNLLSYQPGRVKSFDSKISILAHQVVENPKNTFGQNCPKCDATVKFWSKFV